MGALAAVPGLRGVGMITAALLRKIMPRSGDRADVFAVHLEAARQRWVGDDPRHVAMWLAQIAHESGELRYVREIASGDAYEGRADLGNTEQGDGIRFRGRGLIQLTGRSNYSRCGAALGLPLLDGPELLEQPEHAAASAGWFWSWSGCADRMSAADPVLAVTRVINGGTNGLAQRRAYFAAADIAPTPAAPITESQPTYTAPEAKPVAPILAALFPSIIAAIPELAKVFGSGSAVSERNAKAAEVVAQVVQQATGAVNVQQAVERVTSDPAARQAAADAVQAAWFEIAESGGGGIEGARKQNLELAQSGIPAWQMPAMIVSAALLLMLFMVVGAVLFGNGWSNDIKLQVVTAVLSILGVVGSYWLGSSASSQRKDQR